MAFTYVINQIMPTCDSEPKTEVQHLTNILFGHKL